MARLAAAGALAVVILLRPGPPPAAQEPAPDLTKVTFKAPDDRLWIVGNHAGDAQAMLLNFVAEGETMDDWTELVTIQAFNLANGAFPPPDEAARMLEERMRSRCPDVVWTVIARNDWSVTYRWRTQGCKTQANESEVARVMVSPDRTVRIAYTTRHGPLSRAERDRLVHWLDSFTPDAAAANATP